MKNSIIKDNKAQAAIFVIIAIVIVGGLVIYFLARGLEIGSGVPKEFEPVYSYYLSCIEQATKQGALILGEQAGYIENPEFEAGSEYMPFSSELGFLGIGVPYWYTVLGNGVVKEQIPSKSKMQVQLNDFVAERLKECDFSEYSDQGFIVNTGNAEVDTIIGDLDISVNINQDFSVSYGGDSWNKNTHITSINSNIGKLYGLAENIYNYQKENMFLENYGVDILRLYAPVDGSEITCSPKIWNLFNIREELTQALEGNVPAVKLKGDYYNLARSENKYFEIDTGKNIDVTTNFLYLRDWPMKLEVWPSEDNFLIAQPVGLQEGLGMLGFCYVPYHYVYDFAYPVMIQLFAGDEMFQFPVVVYINKNKPREAPQTEGTPNVIPELCQHKNNQMSVDVYDTKLNPVDASIRFKCFDTSCYIGETENGALTDYFPQCVNGAITANAEGYKKANYQIESINENQAVIILSKTYILDLEIDKQGFPLSNEYAIVNFISDDETKTLSYPEQKQIELSEGQYKVKTYIYANSTIKLDATKSEKCVDAPKSGLLGAFGVTEKKCFTVEIPSQIISFAISGGGTQNYYFSDSELENAKKITINSEAFSKPTNVLELQENYDNVETNSLNIILE
ncbi:MAG: hypothetical protein WC438_02365 [Candidatus Pacearchaeota archaeon]